MFVSIVLVQAAGFIAVPVEVARAAEPCDTPANEVVAENCLPGNPAFEWDIAGSGDPTIQGFATDISVNRGGTIEFKIDTTARRVRDPHLPVGLLRR